MLGKLVLATITVFRELFPFMRTLHRKLLMNAATRTVPSVSIENKAVLPGSSAAYRECSKSKNITDGSRTMWGDHVLTFSEANEAEIEAILRSLQINFTYDKVSIF